MPITDERITEIARDAIRNAVSDLTNESTIGELLWDDDIDDDPDGAYERLEDAIRAEARYADGTAVLKPRDDEELPPGHVDHLR